MRNAKIGVNVVWQIRSDGFIFIGVLKRGDCLIGPGRTPETGETHEEGYTRVKGETQNQKVSRSYGQNR